jgi:hypothetical protein
VITAVLLWIPLVAAVALTAAFLFSDADRKWKAACVLGVAAGLALRLVPGLNVPFVVPLLVESAVAIPLSIWVRMQCC